jgi:hypothetical protein
MSKLAVGLLALVLGIVIGAFGAMRLGGGAALGAGIGTGLAAGICSVVEAGKATGLLTDEAIGTILARATSDFGEIVPEGTDLSKVAADCVGTMAKLRASGASN